MITSFFMNLFVAGSLSQILGMINSLQLIVHLPMMAVSVPANVMMIEGILIPIVMFDIFESDDLFKIADSILGTNMATGDNEEPE
jgi:hypothetical protein